MQVLGVYATLKSIRLSSSSAVRMFSHIVATGYHADNNIEYVFVQKIYHVVVETLWWFPSYAQQVRQQTIRGMLSFLIS